MLKSKYDLHLTGSLCKHMLASRAVQAYACIQCCCGRRLFAVACAAGAIFCQHSTCFVRLLERAECAECDVCVLAATETVRYSMVFASAKSMAVVCVCCVLWQREVKGSIVCVLVVFVC